MQKIDLLANTELLSISRPAQYLGGELNSVTKLDSECDLHFALCFPDTYEVGMSHLGLQLVYQIINSDPKAWAERAFMPERDMELLLKEKNAPLTSLESHRPLSQFDFVGFSLQYELCATNVLSMLELGGIKLLAEQRGDDEPLIIGGGPYSYHPEPIAPFFDIFLLGDSEEALAEILAAYRKTKEMSRREKLKELSKISGIYVPSYFTPKFLPAGELVDISKHELAPADSPDTITRRLLPTMNGAPYAKTPIIPNIKTVHNRLSVEVMRGCVRGCRFCQAGYLYRPQRERSPEEVISIIKDTLPKTGFEEVSLLSLSTADYCSIVPVLKNLMDTYGESGEQLSVSFPSTRVDALTPDVLDQVQRVRRTNLTLAPEAGTQRLRDVINKGVTDEQILNTCSHVFKSGWEGVKLYFMLGLPTETDEDLLGIIDIAKRIKSLPEAKNKEIVVSVSNHVPKPHTPFQWAEQITKEEMIRKRQLLADGCKKIRVTFRHHDAFSSFLEGVLCRGDRKVATAILRAYELGCRLDAWQEHLKEDLWMQAFAECGIDPTWYLRERETTETLPWDHLSCGIPKSYFEREYKRALKHRVTHDCLYRSCSICGVCDYETVKNVLWAREETERAFGYKVLGTAETEEHVRTIEPKPTGVEERVRNTTRDQEVFSQTRYRITYAKSGIYRFVGHLELSLVIERALRRSGLPIAFTFGYRPRPRIVYGPPLPLGVESSNENFDIYLTAQLPNDEVLSRFSAALPINGLQTIKIEQIQLERASIQEEILNQDFEVKFLREPVDPVLSVESLTVTRALKAKRGRRAHEQEFKLQDYVSDLTLDKTKMRFRLHKRGHEAQPRIFDIINAISGLERREYEVIKVQRELQTAP
jgi:radical SAM family uncharacterized protein/radical SAM-linked protein